MLCLQRVSRAPRSQNPTGSFCPNSAQPPDLWARLGQWDGSPGVVVFLVISVRVTNQSPQCNSSKSSKRSFLH